MDKQVEIDFWGIGAQKAGTSWLFHQLSNTPGFSLPPAKEFHYFDRDVHYPSPNKLSKTYFYHRVTDDDYLRNAINIIRSHARKHDWQKVLFYWKWYFSNYTDRWYLSMFRQYKGFTGEITPSYSILDEDDIRRMYRLSPGARLVLMLRNPVERAWSQYRFHHRNFPDFSANSLNETAIINFMESDTQLLRSDYTRTIKNFSGVFPKDQILIGFYDAITDNPEQLLGEIIRFISRDTENRLNRQILNKVYNKSRAADMPPPIREYLENKYYPQIRQLATDYGGYFSKWLEETYGEQCFHENKTLSPTFCLAHAHIAGQNT